METNLSVILLTIVNIVLLIFVLVFIYKRVTYFERFVKKNNEMDKKLDDILKRLEK